MFQTHLQIKHCLFNKSSQRLTENNIKKNVNINYQEALKGGFLCTVLDLSGTLWPLLIPEYSGIKRRGTLFVELRNPGISHYGDKYPLPFYEPYGKK